MKLSIQQLERIIRNAKKEQRVNKHFSDSLEITQSESCTTVLLLTSDEAYNSDVIINEFYSNIINDK